MTEPDVTLTDYAIALECAVFAMFAWRWPTTDHRLRYWWTVFFASISVGSLIGGTVHGFFLDPSPTSDSLWRATLLSLGVTAASMWMIGARLQSSGATAVWVARLAIVQLALYTAVVLFLYSGFVIAIATYVPATVFLLVVMILIQQRAPHRSVTLGISGLVLTFVAAAVQQMGIAVHPVYFNHNALYHLIQGIALFLIFRGAKWLVTSPSGTGTGPRVQREQPA
jgi:hypothetical protein